VGQHVVPQTEVLGQHAPPTHVWLLAQQAPPQRGCAHWHVPETQVRLPEHVPQFLPQPSGPQFLPAHFGWQSGRGFLCFFFFFFFLASAPSRASANVASSLALACPIPRRVSVCAKVRAN
jgi:hypothetical protein